MSTPERRTPDWLLERIALGELPAAELAAARARLAEEPGGLERLQRLQEENARVLQALPPRGRGARGGPPRPRARGPAPRAPPLALLRPGAPRSPPRWPCWWWCPVRRARRPSPQDAAAEVTRIKGDARLLVFRQGAGEPEQLRSGGRGARRRPAAAGLRGRRAALWRDALAGRPRAGDAALPRAPRGPAARWTRGGSHPAATPTSWTMRPPSSASSSSPRDAALRRAAGARGRARARREARGGAHEPLALPARPRAVSFTAGEALAMMLRCLRCCSPRASRPLLPRPRPPRATVRRLALLVGVNDGGPERVRLRYAASDARGLRQRARRAGRRAPRGPRACCWTSDRAGLLAALEQLRALHRGARGPRGAARVEVLVYYSGHSDEEGLLLQRRARGLRRAAPRRCRRCPRTCASPCWTPAPRARFARRKGGTQRPAFLVDASQPGAGPRHPHLQLARTRPRRSPTGWAARFFTHYLVSGLRGAADVTRRRARHPQRGLPVRLPRDAGAHRADAGRRAAPRLRHRARGHRRPGDDGPARHPARASSHGGAGGPPLRARRGGHAGGGAAKLRGPAHGAGAGAGRYRCGASMRGARLAPHWC